MLGRPRLHLRETSSTSDRARELAAAGAPHGTLVTADEQVAGRGRQGRSWAAPAGRALIASLVLRDPPALLPLAAAAAVADVAGPRARVKWPNDVLVGEAGQEPTRKVAGILAEGRPQEHWAVLGIGLNVAVRPQDLPPDLRERAGSLGRAPEELEAVLGELLVALERWTTADDAAVLDAVRARDALLGRTVRWARGEGVGAGLDDAGRLLVRRPDGTLDALDAGEVHLSR
jgi:BirA family biotin operon repressor/biotin-[acetyl-CoA-carboxylase] ligase